MVNWFRVLADLRKEGRCVLCIAGETGIQKNRLYRARKDGIDLRHRQGMAVLALWCKVTGRPEVAAPQLPDEDGLVIPLNQYSLTPVDWAKVRRRPPPGPRRSACAATGYVPTITSGTP